MGKKSYANMRDAAFIQFNFLWEEAEGKEILRLPYGKAEHKYVIFSDSHIGDKSNTDPFGDNAEIMSKALDYYFKRQFGLIVLGDIEEFHRFELGAILTFQKPIFDQMQRFARSKRFYRVFGNHDIEWSLVEPVTGKKLCEAYEAIKLVPEENLNSSRKDVGDILITHGHQAEAVYEQSLHAVRIGTSIGNILEQLPMFQKDEGFLNLWIDPPSKKDQIYSEWAESRKKIMICGHTHVPSFAQQFVDKAWIEGKISSIGNDPSKASQKSWLQKKLKNIERTIYEKRQGIPNWSYPISPNTKLSTRYYNSGACKFSDAITNLEISGSNIRLLYWYSQDLGNAVPEVIYEGQL